MTSKKKKSKKKVVGIYMIDWWDHTGDSSWVAIEDIEQEQLAVKFECKGLNVEDT